MAGAVRTRRWTRRIPLVIGLVALGVAIAFPYLVDRPRFWLPNIGVRSIWLGIIAMSLVFLNRYVGLLSLAQVTVAGISAYGVGYVMVTLEQDFLLGALVGILAGTVAAFLIALIAARTRAIYFLMITLAIGQVFYSWASQAIEVTNARRGLAPVLKPDWGVVNLNDITTFYYFALAVGVLCYLLCRYVGASTFGLTLQGVRDSPDRMKALGYNVNAYRIAATTFAGFIASVGGVLLVLDRAQVDPDVVSLGSTLDVLVVAVVGGIGSLGGVFAGAVVLTLLSNFAQNLTDRYMTLTGLVFILILLFAPSGLAGIGRQVKRFVDRRRAAGAGPSEEPPTAPSTEHAITEGKQR
ncbi:branched-chain amino acid ABC transporter permease [Protaetiibacter intestinalis]|uniref:Branched-chain amino acid ABC transporter permease n=1 Tax=Protaetiibacter intestinalis TaxID=2419774 RepID=A0A387BFM9_9MICO|nr:branched-chain amino acid ABC transporter permease [Protaetiibacter intestinalis]AYF97310.1 branched-chain amino acid ABC transporter permease [Protaetiibacter intestinalis]